MEPSTSIVLCGVKDVLALAICSGEVCGVMWAEEVHTNGEASTSGRVGPPDVLLGGGKSRFSAVVLDAEGVAAHGALRECCVFVVPQARLCMHNNSAGLRLPYTRIHVLSHANSLGPGRSSAAALLILC